MATQQYKHTRTRSPYFIQMASSETGVTCELYIWTGDGLLDVPASPQYTLTKEVFDGAATFEVSELIRDFISQNTTLTSGTVWWKADMNDGVASTSTIKELATEGYHTYESGLQHPSVNVVPKTVALPVDTDGTFRVTTATNSNGVVPVIFNNIDAINSSYTAYDYDNNVILTSPIGLNENHNGQILYFTVNTSVQRVELDYNGSTQTCYVDNLRCSEYEPLRLLYVNKYGAKNYMHFGLKSVETISASSDTFKRSLVNYTALTNGNTLHASRKRITGSKQSFVLNTDWLDEYYTQQIEELMLSEYVWLARTTGNPIPVNIKTSELKKKTHLNDKLINYTIEVETASEYINTVR